VVACVLALFKLLAPEGPVREWFRRLLALVAELWIGINNLLLGLYRTRWDVELPENLSRKGCYLVNSNHQSWVDILVLQRCFNRRLPLLRFFLKSQLFWVPFLGVAWWALDFPYMRRYSKEQISRQPGLKGKDLENARRACEKFRNIPVAMMNFPEGTRFSEAKRDRYGSPYENLLEPRIGGMGQVLYALGESMDSMIDVTIAYPVKRADGRAPTFWDLLTGEAKEIVVRATEVEVPAHLLGRNFRTDRAYRSELEDWVREIWQQKDRQIGELNGKR
jgi:1-acyl-sn-glycerol-3-phosphate acyltransferase